jgi:delta 1-pyrroline-5-carboxylate dehydrogenase
MGYIESGKSQGAKVHIGGERHGDVGYWVRPTIFTDVSPDMTIMREEIFGPVCAVAKFADEDEVVRMANDTTYGLGACVFSQNIKRALDTAHRMEAGSVWVNCTQTSENQVPFGGYKQSGIGRELGEYALAKCVVCCDLQSVGWTLTDALQLHEHKGRARQLGTRDVNGMYRAMRPCHPIVHYTGPASRLYILSQLQADSDLLRAYPKYCEPARYNTIR